MATVKLPPARVTTSNSCSSCTGACIHAHATNDNDGNDEGGDGARETKNQDRGGETEQIRLSVWNKHATQLWKPRKHWSKV